MGKLFGCCGAVNIMWLTTKVPNSYEIDSRGPCFWAVFLCDHLDHEREATMILNLKCVGKLVYTVNKAQH